MTEQLVAVAAIEVLNQKISKLEAKNQVNEFQTRLLELQNSLHNMGNLQEKS